MNYLSVFPDIMGTLPEQAQTIRTWMENHADLLSEIDHLDLQDIDLSAVSPEFDIYFTGLFGLSLQDNHLTEAPNFVHLLDLQRLNLAGNQLTEVPDFTHLENLTNVSLKHNPFSTATTTDPLIAATGIFYFMAYLASSHA